jgi:hypothetical protein
MDQQPQNPQPAPIVPREPFPPRPSRVRKNLWLLLLSAVLIAAAIATYNWGDELLGKVIHPRNQSDVTKPVIQAQQTKARAEGAITFTDNPDLFIVSKSEFEVGYKFNTEALEEQSAECNSNKSQSYFIQLLGKFDPNEKGVEYSFKYTRPSQDTGIYRVVVIPNKLGYKTLEEFSKDFDLCMAGGGLYPTMMNDSYLLFIYSCTTGFDGGSSLPRGCVEVRNFVEPTLKLNDAISNISDKTSPLDEQVISAKPGQVINALTISSVGKVLAGSKFSAQNATISYQGQITTEGEYTVSFSEFSGDTYTCFKPSQPLGLGSTLFCLTKPENVNDLFKTNATKGKAQIVITDFTQAFCPCEVLDTATLVKINKFY